jgi:hypothetical protein
MAGTLTISTLSDGINSTSATNPILGSAKAWVSFDSTGTVTIRASYNVSSVTDNGIGDYTVNFTTAMPDANYAVCTASQSPAGSNRNLLAGNAVSGSSIVTSNPTASNIRIVGFTNTFADSAFNYLSIFR